MELLSASSSPIKPTPHRRLFTNIPTSAFKPSLLLKPSFFSSSKCNQGGVSYRNKLPRARLSEETANEASPFSGERNGVVLPEDTPSVNKDAIEKDVQVDSPEERPPVDEGIQSFADFLDKLDIKLDSSDSYSLILYGGGALVALWFLSAVVSSIDSIPLFPKLMEVVGLAYTFWFSTRYLIFKQNREELAAKVKELKQQVLGSDDD